MSTAYLLSNYRVKLLVISSCNPQSAMKASGGAIWGIFFLIIFMKLNKWRRRRAAVVRICNETLHPNRPR